MESKMRGVDVVSISQKNGKREQQREGGPAPIDRPAAHPVRERPEERDRDDLHDGREQDADQPHVARDLQLLSDIGEHEGDADVEHRVVGEPRAYDREQALR